MILIALTVAAVAMLWAFAGTKRSRAYDEGWQAGDAELPPDSCPYNGALAELWYEGWRDSREK